MILIAGIILLCGKICSGKTTYAQKLSKEIGAAILSSDEIMLTLFGQDAGEKHDEYVNSLEKYIYKKAVELVQIGINTIIDIGLWTREKRNAARSFFAAYDISAEIHYIDISDKEWKRRILKRNKLVKEQKLPAYFVDDGLVQKASLLFEEPNNDEIDVRIEQ